MKTKLPLLKRFALSFFGVLLAVLSFSSILPSTPVFADDEDTTTSEVVNLDDADDEESENTEESTEEDTENNAENNTEDNAETAASTSATDSDTHNSCFDQTDAIGWLICPTTGVIAKAIDNIYGIIENFLTIDPIIMQEDSPIRIVWSYCRDITNIIFIIFIIIVVYSQVTGLGISNYGIKKTLPRIIIAALLVNLSFIICSAAVDISNIIGGSLKGLFTSVQESTIASNASLGEVAKVSWTDLTAVFTGSTAVAGIAIGAAGGLSQFFWMLIPILLGAIVSIVIGLITISLRQAIVFLLVMISPLAFVAYLLPNTEKWFTKWRQLLTQMLVFYPMFSLLFGASQLAGWILMTSIGSGFGLILGMAVQVFPLFFAWSLMKMSGTVLGKISSGLQNIASRPQGAFGRYANEKRNIARSEYTAKQLRKPFNPISGGSWNARLARNRTFRADRQNLANENTKLLLDEQLTARKIGKRIISYTDSGKPIYSSRPIRATRELSREFENREMKLRSSANHLELDNTMSTMGTYISQNKLNNSYLSDLAARQAQNYLEFRTQSAAAKRNDLADNRFYFNTVKEASLKPGSKEYHNLIERGAGADFYIDPTLAGTKYLEAKKTSSDAVVSVIADAYDSFEAERAITVKKYTTYFGKQVTKDVLKNYNAMIDNKNIDGIVAAQNTLAVRGDYDKIHTGLARIMDDGQVELTTDFANTLALNLLSFKDADPTLARLGKHINVETWSYTDGKRKDKYVTLEEFYTGKTKVPNAKGEYTTKYNVLSLMQGTSLNGIDRTFYDGLLADINTFYTPERFGGDVEKAEKAKATLLNSMMPQLVNAIPTFQSGSEQINNSMGFLSGLKKENGVWEQIKNKGYSDKEYYDQTVEYLKAFVPSNLVNMKTDAFDFVMQRLMLNQKAEAEASGVRITDEEALKRAKKEFRDIFEAKGTIDSLSNADGSPNTTVVNTMKDRIRDVIWPPEEKK
ncbi:hypothetical protein IJI94_03615 [Candidatus Saccharibacteria bacterium]|nr:hypothetical protein [Candidatus Saccharibacteria bacterium]